MEDMPRPRSGHWQDLSAQRLGGGWHPGVADRSLSGNLELDDALASYSQATREHLQASTCERRTAAVRQDHSRHDNGQPRTAR
jgi:hypothetical protein